MKAKKKKKKGKIIYLGNGHGEKRKKLRVLSPRDMGVKFQSLFTKEEKMIWDAYKREERKIGGPSLFNHPDQLLVAALSYFRWCQNNPIPASDVKFHRGRAVDVHPGFTRPYSQVEFCHYCGVTRSWFRKFRARMANHEIYDSVFSFVDETIQMNQINGALVGKFNPLIASRLNNLDAPQEMENVAESTPEIKVITSGPPMAKSEAEVQKELDKHKSNGRSH